MLKIVFLITCVFAAIMPKLLSDENLVAQEKPIFNWPQIFEGKKIEALELTEREIKFSHNFPGEIRRYSDGPREILIRWITNPSRKVHPSVDCYKGFGYLTQPQNLYQDKQNCLWGAFTARSKSQTLHVREIIRDTQGQTWSDVSAWYWSAILGKTKGPWCAVTVAESKAVVKE